MDLSPFPAVTIENAAVNTPHYVSLSSEPTGMGRREFVKSLGICSVAVGAAVLGRAAIAEDKPAAEGPETNLADFLKTPRTKTSLPGPLPGRVVKLIDRRCLKDDEVDGKVVAEMFARGMTALTGKDMAQSFQMLFTPDDVIGLKVNPVGPLINTKPELVAAVIDWLAANGVPKRNIIIWDRFDYMLAESGFTAERFPEVEIVGLQTMDVEGNRWRDKDGKHLSEDNFDKQVFYYVKGWDGKNVHGYPSDEFYLNQHVFNGEYSYFGKLLTRRLTKIINLAAYKNSGNAISMACKNIAYGSICNCGRLHIPLGMDICADVLAAPVIRDKLVLNVTDGIRGQYDGGPGFNAQFVYPNHTLYFATDPIALDAFCHAELHVKRQAMGIKANDHPSNTRYLHKAAEMGLGVADIEKIRLVVKS